jgi:hypothetical protein
MTLRETQQQRRETAQALAAIPEHPEADQSAEARLARKEREKLTKRLTALDEKISRLTGSGHPTDCTCTRCEWQRNGDGVARVAWAVKVPPSLKERLQAASRVAGREQWERELEKLANRYA